MKKSIILLFAVLLSFSVSAQIQWQKLLGGTGNDKANSIIQTYDSGYVIAGTSTSNNGDVTGNHGIEDCWVVKLNSLGTIDWQVSLGGTGSDVANSIIESSDSGYVIAGWSNSNDGDVTGNHGGFDFWVIKLNASGTIQWQKSLGGSQDDKAWSIIQTLDSGYIVAGNSYSDDGNVTVNHGNEDYWVVKLNSSGTIEWEKSLGGSSHDIAYCIIQTSDSGYMVTGTSRSNNGDVTGNHGLEDYWVVKINASGNIQWQKSFGGTIYDYAYSIIQTYDGGYIVAGYSQSNNGDVTGNHGNTDYCVIKLNSSGTIEWQKSLGGTDWEGAHSIIQISDSGYVIAGGSASNNNDVTGNHGYDDYWVLKLNATGTIEWQQSLGGTDYDDANSIIKTSNSEYAIAGVSSSNNGDVTGNHGGQDYWIVKLSVTTGIENIFSSNAFHVYPNPSTHNFSISANSEFDNAQLNIFNAMGCYVYSCRLNRETKVIDSENFTSGIYYVQIIKGEKCGLKKLLNNSF